LIFDGLSSWEAAPPVAGAASSAARHEDTGIGFSRPCRDRPRHWDTTGFRLSEIRVKRAAPKPRHRMKRPQPRDAIPIRGENDIKKVYTQEQLAEIGAIALTWNVIEINIDFVLLTALSYPISVWVEIAKSIGSLDRKIAILRLYTERNSILTDEAKRALKDSFDAILELKDYRNLIVHSVPFNVDQGIASVMGKSAKATQVLITNEALQGLQARIQLLLAEIPHVDLLLRLGDYQGAKAVYRTLTDPAGIRRTRDVPLQMANLIQQQNKRKALPPLPEFPDPISPKAHSLAGKP